MIIYLDEQYRCHLTQDVNTWGMVETSYFDGKCEEFIEGYRYVPAGCTWTRSDGATFQGLMVAPWRNWSELDKAQRAYEKAQYEELNIRLSEVYENDAE